jgi:hypothetical protein
VVGYVVNPRIVAVAVVTPLTVVNVPCGKTTVVAPVEVNVVVVSDEEIDVVVNSVVVVVAVVDVDVVEVVVVAVVIAFTAR